MDIEQVARMVSLVENSQLYKVTIEQGAQSITIVNNLDQQTASPIKLEVMPNSTASESSASQVRATHVGRIHLSEDAATEPLVSKGDHIEKGQTVGFIDELSRLLPVISDKEGLVSNILVQEGQSVEYGQPIFSLEL